MSPSRGIHEFELDKVSSTRTENGLCSDLYLLGKFFVRRQTGNKTARNKKKVTKKMRKITHKLLAMDQFGVDIFFLPLE